MGQWGPFGNKEESARIAHPNGVSGMLVEILVLVNITSSSECPYNLGPVYQNIVSVTSHNYSYTSYLKFLDEGHDVL